MTDTMVLNKHEGSDLLEAIVDIGEGVFNELITNAPGNARISEHTFVESFIPYFSGQQTIDRKNNIFAQWETLAGGVTKEVDVIGGNNEVIFTVPPLVNTTNVLTNVETNKHLGEVWETYRKMKSNNVAGSEEYLATNATMQVATDGDTETWVKIMSRYGIKTEEEKGKKAVIDDSLDNELSYD